MLRDKIPSDRINPCDPAGDCGPGISGIGPLSGISPLHRNHEDSLFALATSHRKSNAGYREDFPAEDNEILVFISFLYQKTGSVQEAALRKVPRRSKN